MGKNGAPEFDLNLVVILQQVSQFSNDSTPDARSLGTHLDPQALILIPPTLTPGQNDSDADGGADENDRNHGPGDDAAPPAGRALKSDKQNQQRPDRPARSPGCAGVVFAN